MASQKHTWDNVMKQAVGLVHTSFLGTHIIGMEIIDILSSQPHWYRAPPIVQGFAPQKIGDTVLLDGGTQVILDRKYSLTFSVPTKDLARSLDYFSNTHIRPLMDKMIVDMCGKTVACGTLPADYDYQFIVSRKGLTARITRCCDIKSDEIVFTLDILYGRT